jgi:hypothetical protein
MDHAEFEGDICLDTSASHAKAVRISTQRVNLYNELVAEGADLDIAAVFVKIGGYPPVVLRPLRKALLGYSGLDCLSKFTVAAIRELPISIPDLAAPAPADGGDGAVMQTVLYGYVSPTTEGEKCTRMLVRPSSKRCSFLVHFFERRPRQRRSPCPCWCC